MTKRVVFEVRWDKWYQDADNDGGWSIYRDGALIRPDGATAYGVKADAVDAARRVAKREERAELKVKGKSGRIQTRATYPRASDPKGRG